MAASQNKQALSTSRADTSQAQQLAQSELAPPSPLPPATQAHGTPGSAMAPGAVETTLAFQARDAIWIRIQAGQHYKLRRVVREDDPSVLEVPDNVVATRNGDALQLRYADRSSITLENFYSVRRDGAACSVNLVGDSEAGITLSADTAAGAGVPADGGTLVYAHGQHDVLLSMAQGQTAMTSAFSALGDGSVLTYLPYNAHMALATETVAHGLLFATTAVGLASVSGGGSAGVAPASTAAGSVVQGTIQAGPVTVGNDLEVDIFAADGSTLLKAHVAVDGSGHFSTTVSNYSGVVYARLVNKGGAADYLDEATGLQKDLSTPLMAIGVLTAPGATLSLNLNALTTIAANKTGANPSVAIVEAINTAVAHAFGLTTLQDTAVAPTNSAGYNAADGLSEGEKYGAVLAGLSGMDKLNGGSMQTTIDQITSEITVGASVATLSDAIKYKITAGAKVVAVVPLNQPVVTSQFGDAVASLINYQANPVTQDLGLTALENLATATHGAAAPTLFDYANANVTGVDTAPKLQLINDVIATLTPAGVDTVPEVQTLSDAVTAVINGAAGGTPPTLAQLTALGIVGISSINLGALQTAIANTADDGSAVNTQAKIQALVDTLVNNALGVISAYAEANTSSAPATPSGSAPVLSTFSDAGVGGVDSANLGAINDALTTAAIQAQQAHTATEIQAIVDAYRALFAEANAAAPDATPGQNPSAAQFAAIGADIGAAATQPENLALLDDIIGAQSSSGIDTIVEINNLARIANSVDNQADLAAIGITGVDNLSPVNLQSVLNALSGTADDGSGVNTLAKIQALVDGAVDRGVLFDIANTGTLAQTAWASPTDGLLVRDLNQDGVINNGAELFGNGILLADGSHAANGFDALAQFDANIDGRIDTQDAVFQELNVWRDANGDGVSQATELLSLQEAGIVSFNLSATANNTGENGNQHGLESSYTTSDGSVHALDDVWFQQGAQFTLDTDASGLKFMHLAGSTAALDLSTVDTIRLQGLNMIDMLSNQSADDLRLDAKQVVDLGPVNWINALTELTGGSYLFDTTESRHQLLVTGDAADQLTATGGFVDTGLTAILNGHTYEVYNHGMEAQLLIEQSMHRTVVL